MPPSVSKSTATRISFTNISSGNENALVYEFDPNGTVTEIFAYGCITESKPKLNSRLLPIESIERVDGKPLNTYSGY